MYIYTSINHVFAVISIGVILLMVPLKFGNYTLLLTFSEIFPENRIVLEKNGV